MKSTILTSAVPRGASNLIGLLLITLLLVGSCFAQQIKLYPASIRLEKGKTRTVTAVALDASGKYLPNKTFRFSANQGSAVVTVRNSPESIDNYNGGRWSVNLGEIAGVSAGTATVQAAVDGIMSNKVAVTVDDPGAAPVAVINGDNNSGGGTIRVRTGAAIEVNADASRGVHLAEWFWGDGDRTTDLLSATHAYLKSGNYTLRLRVTNDSGQTSEATVPVIVSDPPPATREFIVRTAAELVAAYNQCIGGEHIVIPAGTVITGQVDLPARNFTEYVTIRSSAAMPDLPVRVQPNRGDLAMFRGSYVNEVPFVIRNRASKIRLSGLRFDPYPGGPDYLRNYYLLQIGDFDQFTIEDNPTEIIVDHCVVNPPDNVPVVHAVFNDGYKVSILSSWLGNIKTFGSQDSQAVFTRDGRGAHVYNNTYFEAATENILYGGTNNNIDGLVPTNIEFRRCVFTKRLAWRGLTNSVGETINQKNLFETKNARRMYVEGSLFSNHWDAGRSQFFAILFKSVADVPGGWDGSPWGVSEEIVFENNRISHINGGISVVRDFYVAGVKYDPLKPQHIKFYNNLFDDMGSGRYGTARSWAAYLFGVDDFALKHVSMIDAADVTDQWPDAGIVIESINSYRIEVANSIVPINGYSFRNSCGEGKLGLNVASAGWFDGTGSSCDATVGKGGSWHVSGNIFPKMRSYHNASVYPQDNYYPEDYGSMRWTGYRRCGTSVESDPCDLPISDLTLRSDSPFKNKATDAADPGIDAAVLSDRTKCTSHGDTNACLSGEAVTVNRSVSGRVVDETGRGIPRVMVYLTGPAGTQAAMTSTFGYYIFNEVTDDVTYSITAEHKRFDFVDAPRSISVNQNLQGVDFVGRNSFSMPRPAPDQSASAVEPLQPASIGPVGETRANRPSKRPNTHKKYKFLRHGR